MSAAEIDLRFTLNGREVQARVPSHTLLLDLVRERFGLKGSKRSCDFGAAPE